MKSLYVTIAALLISAGLTAQKYAFVDSEYILSNIPSYQAAEEQLEQISVEWQKEIEAMYKEIDKMYRDFQAEKVYLTEEMKRKREEDIINKEKEVKEKQKKYFGKEGELSKKREELVKPIQDEVFNAIKEMAEEQNYALILDTSGSITIMYSNPRYDLSDDVLERLGYKN